MEQKRSSWRRLQWAFADLLCAVGESIKMRVELAEAIAKLEPGFTVHVHGSDGNHGEFGNVEDAVKFIQSGHQNANVTVNWSPKPLPQRNQRMGVL